MNLSVKLYNSIAYGLHFFAIKKCKTSKREVYLLDYAKKVSKRLCKICNLWFGIS